MTEFEEMLEDDILLGKAKEAVDELMRNNEVDFAVALIVALRDYLADQYDDETAYEILEEIADGLEWTFSTWMKTMTQMQGITLINM